jgi:hypothetical protein
VKNLKPLVISVLILLNTAGAFYAGMETDAFVNRTQQGYALRGCEQVASQVLKDAIIAEYKFNACNQVFEDVKKAFEQ